MRNPPSFGLRREKDKDVDTSRMSRISRMKQRSWSDGGRSNNSDDYEDEDEDEGEDVEMDEDEKAANGKSSSHSYYVLRESKSQSFSH